MNKKSLSRETAEKAENLPEVKNEVPENKYQADQQVNNTDEALKVEPTNGSFNTKKVTAKGSSLKQQVVSDVITGSSSSAGMGITAAGRGVSGTAGGILGANNSTPFAEKSRSDSRVGKKLDRIATKLNYTPSEQVILTVNESKPLADASDEDQGYNGTYRNEYARSQKIMGAAPADLLFQRSVDLIMKDKLYFLEGQQVFQVAGDKYQLNPSTRINPETGEKEEVIYHSGNFLHKAIHFGLGVDGKVRYCYFDVDDLTGDVVSADDANIASAHRLIKANVSELDRMVMDTKAGDEKADIWSPLARAVDEPTKVSYLMSSIEAETGGYVYLAYSKATTNMSYQLNRAAKDGLNILGPAVEQCVGWRCSYPDSVSLQDDFKDMKNYVFKKENYRQGDPSLMIEAYDSIAKYNNKADLLLQPRGWRMHLQTADNNLNPLKIPTEFANVYAANECFSTIDHEYDPLLPICMTDKANIVLVHNLNEQCAFYLDSGAKHIKTTVSYTNLANAYAHDEVLVVEANVPQRLGWETVYIYYDQSAGDGVVYDSTNHVIKIDGDSTNRTDAVTEFLVTPSDEVPDGFTLLTSITASTQTYNVVYYAPKVDSTGANAVTAAVTKAMDKDWFFLNGGTFCYAYSDLRNNYIVEVKHPLVHGMIKYLEEAIGAKMRNLIDQEDLYIPLVFSTQYMTLAQLFICAATPWIAQVRTNSMKDVIYYEDNVKSYPYSKLDSLKNVPFKNYLNFVYSDYDHPLETKVMLPAQAITWVMPEFFWKVGTEKYVLPWYFNENDLLADGSVDDDAANMSMPSIRSGIRLGLLDNFYGMGEKDIRLCLDRMTKTILRDSDISSFGAYKYGRTTDGQILANLGSGDLFTVAKLLRAPRELGLCMDAPLGVLTVDPADPLAALQTPDVYKLKALSADGTFSSYRIKIWTNPNTAEHPDILAATGVNITRAANYTQKWFEITANGATSSTDLTGLVFGMGDDTAVFSPFAALGTGASLGNGVSVVSYQRSLNTRLQFLPFIISPFDGEHTGTYAHDIYDIAYMFGLCGFRASDYRESVYNREKEVVNQGLTFVNDPWILESPLINGATKSTGLKVSKGYEIK